jgi:mycothiol synthase
MSLSSHESLTIRRGVHVPNGLPNDRKIPIPDGPEIPDLSFRAFRGKTDYPLMLAVTQASKHEDRDEWTQKLDDVTRTYRHLVNCNPFNDMIFAEAGEQVVGYGRGWWESQHDETHLYNLFAHLVPSWRGKGIRIAMLRHLERRLAEVAQGHAADAEKLYQAWASEYETDWNRVLQSAGYAAVRWEYEMVRSLAEEIREQPLPDGLEVRPPSEDHVLTIWKAANEAFKDHWGASEWREEYLAEWRESPTFRPELWQVAWDGDEVAGMVLNFVNEKENEEYGRRRGYTETICVRRPWRGRGLAKALITRSMEMFKAAGMTETAHGVDTQNPSGALQLYEGLGYRPRKTYITYRKPLKPPSH